MVLSGVPRTNAPVTPPGIDPGTVRLVAQRLNHYATPGPYIPSDSLITTDIRRKRDYDMQPKQREALACKVYQRYRKWSRIK